MPIDDLGTWTQATAALKNAFDSTRSAIGLVKEAKSLAGGGTEQEQRAIDVALTTASSNTAIAEAEIAKALGYELCKCDFPPTLMKTVAYVSRPFEGHKLGEPVYECRWILQCWPLPLRKNRAGAIQRMTRLLISMIGGLLLSSEAAMGQSPQFDGSANYVMPGCRHYVAFATSEPFLQGMCVGTILAAIAVGRNYQICLPTGTTIDQRIRVVAQYVDSQPARLHEDFLSLAIEALQKAWPCH